MRMEFFYSTCFSPAEPGLYLLKLGVDNPWIILTLGVVFALLFSILAETVISRFKVLRYAFLGLTKRER